MPSPCYTWHLLHGENWEMSDIEVQAALNSVYSAKQQGKCDLTEVLANYLQINNLHADTHLFAYKMDKRLKLLTRTMFVRHSNEVAKGTNTMSLKFHGIL
ncbi:hypothetical protein J132_10167 [Termitomyces sp. J132]|nr:hypothetical protein J132_10167 [Termitomyces sp. J132]